MANKLNKTKEAENLTVEELEQRFETMLVKTKNADLINAWSDLKAAIMQLVDN